MERRVDFDVATSVSGIPRSRGLPRLLPPSKGEYLGRAWTSWPAPISPKGKPLGSHMVG